jgi:spermidine/putrescine transport system permease protein
VKIYNAARADPTPAVNAAATFLLVTTTLAIVIGYLAYKRITRDQRASLTDFAQY